MAHIKYNHVSNLRSEHTSWLRGLEFYHNELITLKDRLKEVTDENLKQEETQSALGNYKKTFERQSNDLNNLKADILNNYDLIREDLETKGMHVGNSTLAETDSLRNRYIGLEKEVNDMRHNFNRFFCDHMRLC